jgi:hypothetical protein
LDYISSTALTLNGGTINDLAGNPANLNLPSPGSSGSLSFSKNIVIQAPLPAPTFGSISPTSGGGGTVVTITGTGFTTGATVTLGGVPATSISVSSDGTTVTATLPSGVPGTPAIVITNTDGQNVTLAGAFTYSTQSSVTAVTPAFGPTAGGTAVNILGSNFAGSATVTIGGVAATGVTVIDSGTISAITPPHATGNVDVVVTISGTPLTLTGGYRYDDPPVPGSTPTITPGTLTAGQQIVIVAGATDPEGAPLVITYDFGDGTVNTTGQHTYSSPGNYTILISATDGVNTISLGSMSVTIGDPTIKVPMTISKFSGAVKFGVTFKDQCSVSGIIPNLPPLLNPLGKILDLNVGGATAQFVLDAKGGAKNLSGSIKMKFKFVKNATTKVKEFLGGPVLFQAKIKGTFQTLWLDEGVDPTTENVKTPITFATDIVFNSTDYTATVNPLLTSKPAKSGKFAFTAPR